LPAGGGPPQPHRTPGSHRSGATVSLTRQLLRWPATAVVVLVTALLPCSTPMPGWQAFALAEGSIVPLGATPGEPESPPTPRDPDLPSLPEDWRVVDRAWADVTNDGSPEWVLLVWRPWRDWAIQRWSPVPSPIAGFHDSAGQSCHVILLEPNGREIWAGSALPAPLLTVDVGDVDGDGRNELVTLEGQYADAPQPVSTHLDVWRWDGFGFGLEARAPAAGFRQARLTHSADGSILGMVVR